MGSSLIKLDLKKTSSQIISVKSTENFKGLDTFMSRDDRWILVGTFHTGTISCRLVGFLQLPLFMFLCSYFLVHHTHQWSE